MMKNSSSSSSEESSTMDVNNSGNEEEELGFTEVIHEGKNLLERSKTIPLRLTDEERSLLRIIEGGLEISEYTDKVDVTSSMYGSYWSHSISKKVHLIEKELKEILGFISGLYVANNYSLGGSLVSKDKLRNFQVNEEFFQKIFEIGRRYKIMNPDKMRTTYGKLMYIIQDAITPGVLDFEAKIPIQCVHDFLADHNVVEMLSDNDMIPATQCLTSTIDRQKVKELTLAKTQARTRIIDRYASSRLTKDKIHLVLESLTDSNAYILANRHPVDRMIYFLKKYFDPLNEDREFSLSISYRVNGSCLSHSHSVQYNFVYQSLLLWREIQHEMFHLWNCADSDLLAKRSYNLEDTGQGLQRVQSAPYVADSMRRILGRVQQRLNSWVGLSVVHLGDRDVPNALVFIDKYTQVPRILAPIVNTIERIGELKEDPLCGQFIEEAGGVEYLRRKILCDYFKHGFDGSGDDGGSCIDGRLTSSWNWTSKIEKKGLLFYLSVVWFLGV